MDRPPPIAVFAIAAILAAGPAAAPDAAQVVASAQQALSAYQFASALEQFLSIPDTAAAGRKR